VITKWLSQRKIELRVALLRDFDGAGNVLTDEFAGDEEIRLYNDLGCARRYTARQRVGERRATVVEKTGPNQRRNASLLRPPRQPDHRRPRPGPQAAVSD
jgi:hypothetical protein